MQRRYILPLMAFIAWGSLAGCDTYNGPARVIDLGLHSDSHTGAIMVSARDNLYAIARRYRLPIRDIIALNALEPPYRLAENQRLKLPAPVDYRVGERDTIQSVAALFGVSTSQLVTVNNIQPPFRLMKGQVLRIPSSVSHARDVAVMQREQGQKQVIPRPVESAQRAAPRPVGSVSRESLAPPARSVAPAPPTTVAMPRHAGFVWPVRGTIISGYGPKADGLYNDGINIAAPRGAAVVAAGDGVVAYVGDDLKSYGKLILIRHGGGLMTAYAHLSAINVRKGATVRKGQAIGAVGATGAVQTSQLHFEIRQGSKTYDPRSYL